MAWAGGVWDSTYGTDVTTITAGINTYYSKRFLKRALHTLKLAPFGQKRDLPKNAGDSIQFFRYNEIGVSASGAYLTDGTNPDPTLITGHNVSVQPVEWGAFSQHSRLVSDEHIDRQLKGVSALWGSHAGNLVDLITHMAVCSTGAYPYRCDGANSGADDFSYHGTVTAGTSTTVFADTDFASNTDYGDGNDDGNQSIIVFTSGAAYGQARACTDYVTSGGVITVTPALDTKPEIGDTFVIVSAHELTSSHILTTGHIRNALVILRNNKAMELQSGHYVGILSPQTEASLMADTNWLNVMQYKDRPEIKVSGLFTGEVGEWGGVRWVRTTQPFRFPIAAEGTAGTASGVGALVPGSSYTNYASDGAVYANLILGQEAFGCTTLKGNNYMAPGIIHKKSGPQDTSNPLNRFSTVGWYLPFIAKGLNPMFAVQLWSGA